MFLHRYRGRYSKATRDLMTLGMLSQYPTQKDMELFRDYGVNIKYRLKGAWPEKFKSAAPLFLEAAVDECNRYPEFKWYFARFEVQLSRTAKGRKSLPITQTYTAGKHIDPVIMVYGPKGGVPDEETNFLVDQVNKILEIPIRYLGRVNKQKPYKVLWMEVCVRAGEKLEIPESVREEKQ